MRFGFGIDVGGTTVKLAFFDETGIMLDKWEIPTVTEEGGKHILPHIAASIRDFMTAYQINPAVVLGIGIGGTANIAANLAKEAACLRTVGSHNPDPQFRQIEEDLYEALNSLGVGIMGIGGDTSVLGVNVEYAYTHIAGICVAISSNCMVARRASSRILEDGSVEQMESPNWFGGR